MNLLTWNVQWFCGLDDHVSIERVLARARELADFDVMCFQEVAVNYPLLPGGAGFDQVARLQALLPDYQVLFAPGVVELGRGGEQQAFGNVIASRLPVAHWRSLSLPYPADAGVRSMPRSLGVATVITPSGPLRVMTTHLEFYSRTQRLAQVEAIRASHEEACAHAQRPPLIDETGWPFQSKPHTARCVLTGDFNFEPGSEEYRSIQLPFGSTGVNEVGRGNNSSEPLTATRLVDAWTVAQGSRPHAPTFRLFDRRYGPDPISCDFVFVSNDLAASVRRIEVDLETKVSDHQPVWVVLED